MKTQAPRIAALAVVLIAVSVAVAQNSGEMKFNVPFPFAVANHQMQPGRYQLKRMAEGVFRMKDATNQLNFQVHSVQGRAGHDPRLVFHRYGDSYFLAEVWTGGSDIGKQISKSKAEAEIASGKINGTRPKSEIAILRPSR